MAKNTPSPKGLFADRGEAIVYPTEADRHQIALETSQSERFIKMFGEVDFVKRMVTTGNGELFAFVRRGKPFGEFDPKCPKFTIHVNQWGMIFCARWLHHKARPQDIEYLTTGKLPRA